MATLNSPTLSGDIGGKIYSTSVNKIKGIPVSSSSPTAGQVFSYNGTEWSPSTVSSDTTKLLPLSGGTMTGGLTGTTATFSTSVSAVKFYGDGSSLTGIVGGGGSADTTKLLPLSGGTMTGGLTGTTATFNSVSASKFYGDGSSLTGVTSADAVSIRGRNISPTAPTEGQVLVWNSSSSQWEPTSLNGSVTFNTAGTHTWVVPAWMRWGYVSASSAAGTDGTGTNGQPGQTGVNAYFDTEGNPVAATTGANGADGTAAAGIDGKGITIAALSWSLPGGTGGAAGIAGFGGGGSGGGGAISSDGTVILPPAPGSTGNGPNAGSGGSTGTPGLGGSAGGVDATAGGDGSWSDSSGGAGGTGAANGGNGGNGGTGGYVSYGGGGGGGGQNYSGGGGGAGGGAVNYAGTLIPGSAGFPGSGGLGTPGELGTPGASFADPVDFSAVAGTTISIVISEGAGDASITISY